MNQLIREDSGRDRKNLEDIMWAVADGVVVCDSRLRVMYMNPAAAALTGCDSDDVRGVLLNEVVRLVDPDTRESVRVVAPDTLREGHGLAGSTEHIMLARHGRESRVVLDRVLLRGAQEEPDGIALILRECSAAAADKAARTMLAALFKCVPGFVSFINMQERIEFISRVLPHHKMEEVVGAHWLKYTAPKEHERMQKTRREVLATSEPRSIERLLIDPDGTKRWFSTQMGAMHVDGRLIGIAQVSQDITELKRAQEDFASAQRMASVGTLAAGVAHEINTPIQFVRDSVTFLQEATSDLFEFLTTVQKMQKSLEGADDPQLRAVLEEVAQAEEGADLPYLLENAPKAFERCLDGLERVATVVRSMKEFAHPSQGTMESVDLNRAVRNTLTIAASEYKYVADLESDFAELPPVTCFVNDVNQVVLNLVVNASHAIGDVMKLTGERGKLVVRTCLDGDVVVISVSDTGTGIPVDARPHVFEPFFTTKEVGKGTGQGLAIAHAIVHEKHGGTLTFETEIGKGTTFFIRLPIVTKASD